MCRPTDLVKPLADAASRDRANSGEARTRLARPIRLATGRRLCYAVTNRRKAEPRRVTQWFGPRRSNAMKQTRIFTRTILLVSFVSLFTDIASEMLYPIMPVYLRSIGFSVLLIGILEGLAEATAGLSKGYFGNLSDARRSRVPFVRWGYTLSAFSKPMLALSRFPPWIFLARTLDRFGKGVRTSARDAILSDETAPGHKGKVFGFHRAMDTVGAAIGPSLAMVFLAAYPGRYRPLFLIAFLPGLVAVSLMLLLREKRTAAPAPEAPAARAVGLLSYLNYWRRAPAGFRRLVTGLLLFTLFNSSDAFLLLALKNRGFSDQAMIGFYIFYNLAYALLSFPIGVIADRIGLKRTLVIGLLTFAVVYFFFGFAASTLAFAALFFLYGVYASATEGISKAIISNLAAKSDTATALGFFNSLASLFALAASSIAGLLWYMIGPKAMFMVSGAGVFVVAVYLGLVFRRAEPPLP
jgi:MFS family permease